MRFSGLVRGLLLILILGGVVTLASGCPHHPRVPHHHH